MFVINRRNFIQLCLVICNVKQKYLTFFKCLSLSQYKGWTFWGEVFPLSDLPFPLHKIFKLVGKGLTIFYNVK